MAVIIKCDICGTIVENHMYYTLNIDVKEHTSSKFSKNIIEELDLCDDCYKYFLKVIDDLKKGHKNGQAN